VSRRGPDATVAARIDGERATITAALDRAAGIFQMRKDESCVTMHRAAMDIVFDCNDRDRVFVHTVVLEVVSDLRRMAAELAKPIDRSALTEGGHESGKVSPASLSLASHLDSSVLNPHLSSTSKAAIIEELVQLAAKSGLIADVDAARDAVMEREASGSTGMQYGVALPHGKTTAVDQIVCAIGLIPEGVDFESLDGEPSRIFVMVLSPKDFAGPHIRFLATISQTLTESGRADLLACQTADAMYAFLTRH